MPELVQFMRDYAFWLFILTWFLISRINREPGE